MSSVDWEQEITQLRREVAELAASGMSKEEGIRAAASMFARMLVRTGAWAPEDDLQVEIVLAGIGGEIVGYEIGPPVIRYGPCYLHPMMLLGKDDTRTPSERYVIMLGAVETPIVGTLDFTPGQHRAPANPHEAGWLAMKTSELPDVARHLRQIAIRGQATIAYDREWQRTHPNHAATRERRIAEMERRIAACEAGLQGLEAEYGAVLATPEANLDADEREREVDAVRRSSAIMSDLEDYVRAQQSSSSTPKEKS